MTACFISDLHLDGSRPEATAAFLGFLRGPALAVERLYILGDLFEAWIGDDDPDPHHTQVREALAAYTAHQPRCYFMPGNRDFMIGDAFLAATGMTLLPDPTLIEVGGTSLLLSHGDIFCTDDLSYQRFRRITHTPWVQRVYRALPFALRRFVVAGARSRSKQSTQTKRPDIMDVNPQAVAVALQRYRVDTLLHGHTHRPGEHEFSVGDRAALRIVLGDWYENGPVLYWDSDGRHTRTLEFAAAARAT